MARRPPDPVAVAFNPPPELSSPIDITKVPARVALEIAEGSQTPYAVLNREGYDEAQIDWLMQHEPFLAQIDRFRSELEKSGYTFKAKTAMLAEYHLDTANLLIADNDTPPAVRLDAIKWLAKMAGLEPKDGQSNGQQVAITINLGEDKAPMVIENTPVPPLKIVG